jgi:hypothetical protein
MLKFLENLELAGISFIRGYIQFLFDGTVLNTYTLPRIKIENKEFISSQYGYCDTLCCLIGKRVLLAYEDEKENRMVIRFENNAELVISLNMEDRQCVEAVMIQTCEGKWEIW